MLSVVRSSRLLLAVGAVLALTLAACGGSDAASETAADSDSGSENDSGSADGGSSADEVAYATPFGEACSQIPTSGEGSAEGMADDPVATAASNNPLLSTLVDFVGQAELADTLNNAEALTVFAPINSAFEALPAETAEAVSDDTQLLTTVLSHHVHAGEQLSADELVEQGSVSTLAEGTDDLQITESGDTIEVAAAGSAATVVCGNVQTANATVFLLDTVLQPSMS